METHLRLFGPLHLAILISVVMLGLAAGWIARRKPSTENVVRWGFAIVTSGLGVSWYLLRYTLLGLPWRWNLPLEVCDVALWATAAALFWPRQRLLELAYYWGLAGASMALLTPYLVAPVGNILSITFLMGHGIIVSAIIFLLGAGRMRPSRDSWRFAFVLLNALALLDFVIDRTLGVNYMYLSSKPPITSLLNVMGPWPWYILSADLVAAVLFLGLQWPFRGSEGSEGSAQKSA